MRNAHEQDLLELVGSPGWRALVREAKTYVDQLKAKVFEPAKSEWDFIQKEIRGQSALEIERFLAYVEQEVERKWVQDS